MRKIMVVFVREYLAHIRSKAFLITLILMPVLMGGGILLQVLVGDNVDTKDRRIEIIDHTGTIFAEIEELAQQRNDKEILDESGQQVAPKFLVSQTEPQDDPQQQLYDLSQRVRDKDLFAFLEIGANLTGSMPDPNADFVRYYSNSPTDREFVNWLRGPLNQVAMGHRFKEANLSAQVVSNAIRPLRVENLGLVELDESGKIKEAEESNRLTAFLVPYGFCMLMFMSIMVSGPQMMQSIIEEKMQRIAEVLIGCVTPFQLMLGKLMGVISVSLTLIGLYLLGGYFVADYYGQSDILPPAQIAWMMVYGFLAMVMFGAVFCGIGAASSEIKDAQSMMMPVTLLIVLPLMLIVPVIQAPNGTLATWLSFFPPATPMTMVTRLAVPPGIPMWQPFAGIVVMLLFSLLCVFAAGRVFRVGILMYGKPPRIGELARWIVSG